MKAKLLVVCCMAAATAGCGGLATPEGMASTEPLLSGETATTKAAYRDWVRCGREAISQQRDDRDQPFAAIPFANPTAERAAAACKSQENLVMTQINLDAFHKNWLKQGYLQDLTLYDQLHRSPFETSKSPPKSPPKH